MASHGNEAHVSSYWRQTITMYHHHHHPCSCHTRVNMLTRVI